MTFHWTWSIFLVFAVRKTDITNYNAFDFFATCFIFKRLLNIASHDPHEVAISSATTLMVNLLLLSNFPGNVCNTHKRYQYLAALDNFFTTICPTL